MRLVMLNLLLERLSVILNSVLSKGVIGLDLFSSRLDRVPRKLGRPRKKSKHKLYANDNYNVVAEAESILKGADAYAAV